MNIAITFRQMEATDAVKTYATDKVARLQKFLRQPMTCQVTLSCQKNDHHAEVELHCDGVRFHAHEHSEDMYASIDRVVDKVERQVSSAKDAASSRKKGADRAADHLPPSTPDLDV